MSGMCVAYAKVAELAAACGARDIKNLPGCWSHQVDWHWRIDINGKDHAVDDIPPYHVAIEYNGWPAGILSPVGGIIAAGEGANESTFIDALDAAIAKAEGK